MWRPSVTESQDSLILYVEVSFNVQIGKSKYILVLNRDKKKHDYGTAGVLWDKIQFIMQKLFFYVLFDI